jgi:hypothetical protein
VSKEAKDKLPTDCGVCRYHINKTKECRRRAPHPGQDDGFVVAVWNRTRDRDRCGSGSTKREMVTCEDCAHWLQPDGKPLSPPFRQGLSREWWENSGYCTRHAPGATVDEGQWMFWKVTNATTGGCAEGSSVSAALEVADQLPLPGIED